MKILFLHNFPQHYREEIFRLIEKKYNVDWIFGDKMENVKPFNYNRFKSVEIKKTWSVMGLKWQNTTKTLFKKYDCVIMFGDYKNISYWLQLFAHRNVIIWTHGYYDSDNFLKKAIKTVFFLKANQVLFYGGKSKKNAPKMIRRKSQLIYNSLPGINDSILKNTTNNPSGILFIGRLTKNRNLDLLISTFIKFKQKNPKTTLHIVGDGEEKERYKKLNHDGVVWHGDIYDIDKLRSISQICYCGIFLGPIGLSVLHYAHFSIPVVAFYDMSFHMPEAEILKESINFFPFKSFSKKGICTALDQAKNADLYKIHKFNNKIISEKYSAAPQLKIINNVIYNI
jgi:glycosyltransferase involved in cell wall biosynthesis